MSDVTMMIQQSKDEWMRLMSVELPLAAKTLEKSISKLKPHQTDKRRSLTHAVAFINHVSTQYTGALKRKAEEDAATEVVAGEVDLATDHTTAGEPT